MLHKKIPDEICHIEINDFACFKFSSTESCQIFWLQEVVSFDRRLPPRRDIGVGVHRRSDVRRRRSEFLSVGVLFVSQASHLFQCFAPQMALLGFFHDFFL